MIDDLEEMTTVGVIFAIEYACVLSLGTENARKVSQIPLGGREEGTAHSQEDHFFPRFVLHHCSFFSCPDHDLDGVSEGQFKQVLDIGMSTAHVHLSKITNK